LGSVLQLLDEDTAVLVMSDHGARPLDGGFCVNEWLVEQGLLVLNKYPDEVTRFSELDVDWDRTAVWSEGGYYARVFLNVAGREPRGVIAPGDYEVFRDELKLMFEQTRDDRGDRMGTVVFKPEEIYRDVRNVAPDLIVHFGDLAWRSIDGVGYPSIHVQENDTGPDDCNHSQFGVFILAAPNSPLQGEVAGAHLLDMAPTLLDLTGYDIPPSMQGRSLIAGRTVGGRDDPGITPEGADAIRRRLSGLGYIS
jgi:predicted AlkP superfamily phosphohydrolase/phosphomutase